jgi:hypothetical protein
MRTTIPLAIEDLKRLGNLGDLPEYRKLTLRDFMIRIFRAGLTALERGAAKREVRE